MMRVMTIFGTRPEAIKMAPVVHALRAAPDIEDIVCVTAQHRDMLDQVLELFGITPDHDLDVMEHGQSLHGVTAKIIQLLQPVLEQSRPDMVLVHGDTATCFAASLAAFYSRVPIGHVEAGLRTKDLTAPFPEEGFRQLTDRLCELYFAPTARSASTLLTEGVNPQRIVTTGNTVIDALLWMKDRLPPLQTPEQIYGSAANIFESSDAPVVLVTGHRRESFGKGFEQICTALRELAQKHPDVQIVYPVHLNPRVQEPVHRLLAKIDSIHLIPPLDYQGFVRLMNRATLILTDSGGIQEEAPSLNKPTLVMREKTERPEGVDAGVVKLVGTNPEKIVAETSRLLSNPEAFKDMSERANPYGDGTAAQQIVAALRAWWLHQTSTAGPKP